MTATSTNHEPLYTKPALEFLNSNINSKWKIFEYGGGFSSIYYNKKFSMTYTVEHNYSWGKVILKNMPSAKIEILSEESKLNSNGAKLYNEFVNNNFNLPIKDDRDYGYNEYHGLTNDKFLGYASEICRFRKGYFDVIIVDGMSRSLCLFYACYMIKDTGYIILNNSDRYQFNALQNYIIGNGFNRKDFWQPDHPCWCTSFFSKLFNKEESNNEPRLENTGDLYHFN